MNRRRVLLLTVGIAALAGAAAWHWQSRLIGIGARWYLARVAAAEDARGDLARRREVVGRTHRALLMGPPPDRLIPELFDLVTAVSTRIATGEIDFAWAAYVYNSYERDLVTTRPSGTPRRSIDDVEAAVAEYVRFYSLRQRPDVPGVRLRDLAGAAPGDSYTVEEIEAAARQGRRLPGE